MASRYAASHLNANGPDDARLTALQIVRDESLESELSDKTILITGCSSGLGIETARALAATGATLFLTVRNPEKAKRALSDILSSDHVHLLEMDLESLASIRAGAAAFLRQSSTLNVLITNAGVRHLPEGRTRDGFERQFGINHLGHFLLFNLLRSTLLASSTPSFHSRVVVLSSTAHRDGVIHFDDLQLRAPGAYTPRTAYGQSKLANVYMANEIERRYGASGLHGVSVHPGGIRTGLQKNGGGIWEFLSWEIISNLRRVLKCVKSPAQGAATTV